MFERMPRLARFMMAGIMIMFVAPVRHAYREVGARSSASPVPAMSPIILIPGLRLCRPRSCSGPSGSASSRASPPSLNVETTVHRGEVDRAHGHGRAVYAVLRGSAVLSTFLVEPYIFDVFGVCSQGVSQANLWVAACFRPWCSWSCSAAGFQARSSRFPSTSRRQREPRQPHVPQLFVRETMAYPATGTWRGVFGEQDHSGGRLGHQHHHRRWVLRSYRHAVRAALGREVSHVCDPPSSWAPSPSPCSLRGRLPARRP